MGITAIAHGILAGFNSGNSEDKKELRERRDLYRSDKDAYFEKYGRDGQKITKSQRSQQRGESGQGSTAKQETLG